MMPKDDLSWPKCGIHSASEVTGDSGMQHWCDWTRQYLIDNRDSEELKFDGAGDPRFTGSVAVPIVPQHDLYAEVTIGDEVIPGLSYMLKLVVPQDSNPFGIPDDDEMIDLGLYTRGEGRLVIATSINDWASGYDGECKATSHGFLEEMLVQQAQNTNDVPTLKSIKLCVALYKKCFFCYRKGLANSDVAPVPDFNAVSFGINLDDFRGGNRPANARQNRARQALQGRYGNRVTAGLAPTDIGDNYWPKASF